MTTGQYACRAPSGRCQAVSAEQVSGRRWPPDLCCRRPRALRPEPGPALRVTHRAEVAALDAERHDAAVGACTRSGASPCTFLRLTVGEHAGEDRPLEPVRTTTRESPPTALTFTCAIRGPSRGGLPGPGEPRPPALVGRRRERALLTGAVGQSSAPRPRPGRARARRATSTAQFERARRRGPDRRPSGRAARPRRPRAASPGPSRSVASYCGDQGLGSAGRAPGPACAGVHARRSRRHTARSRRPRSTR